jgi:membrane associated rhomboid family serine protease
MVLPLHDDTPLKYVRRPIVNWSLLTINILVFVAVWGEYFGDPITVIRGFGLIPAVLFDKAELAPWIVTPGPEWTLLTSLFFHSGIGHLAGNMVFLYVFGDNVEDAMGSFHYLLFYLLCGVSAGLLFAFGAPNLITPLVGASGAISGVCAAFLLLYPRSSIFGLVAGIFPIHAPAFMFVGTWILLQVFNAFIDDKGHVGWWAHVGGVVVGLLLTPLFKRRSAPLFGPPPFKGPWEQ